MSKQMDTYKKWCHVGVPGFDFVEVSKQRAGISSEYLPGVELDDRWGRPRYDPRSECARFEVVVDARVAIMTGSGLPSKKDLRNEFEMTDVVQGALGEAVISNGSVWGVVTTGRTAWGDLRASDAGKVILMFRFRLADIDDISLRLDGGLRGQGEYPVQVTSLAPGAALNLEVRREYAMPKHKGSRVKSSRGLFDSLVAAATEDRLKRSDEVSTPHLEAIKTGGMRDTSDPKAISVELDPPDHWIQLDDHGLRVDRPHWPRPKSN